MHESRDSIDEARRESVRAFETVCEHFADACVRERGVRARARAKHDVSGAHASGKKARRSADVADRNSAWQFGAFGDFADFVRSGPIDTERRAMSTSLAAALTIIA